MKIKQLNFIFLFVSFFCFNIFSTSGYVTIATQTDSLTELQRAVKAQYYTTAAEHSVRAENDNRRSTLCTKTALYTGIPSLVLLCIAGGITKENTCAKIGTSGLGLSLLSLLFSGLFLIKSWVNESKSEFNKKQAERVSHENAH